MFQVEYPGHFVLIFPAPLSFPRHLPHVSTSVQVLLVGTYVLSDCLFALLDVSEKQISTALAVHVCYR